MYTWAAAPMGRVGQRPPTYFEILKTCPSITSTPNIPFHFLHLLQKLTPERTFADHYLCITGLLCI